MGAKEKATRIHESGYNCAQSVLGALGEYTGLDEATAMAASSGFGGGARCGEICGSVSGGVMAIGLVFSTDDEEGKSRIKRMTAAYCEDFAAHFGCIRCQDLKRSGQPCAAFIEYAAQMAEKMIIDNK